MYDENVFYHWTPKEWGNRIKGAQLAIVDAQERAIEAAWVAGVSSNPDKKGKFKPAKDFYDAKTARDMIITGNVKKKKADFTFYDKAREGFINFDWKNKLILPDKKKKGR